ncbi:MAG: hypothetical protein FWE23_08385 [Chitinivibrionia bacterium]|nr:hypothetical protein [Chitinivibrionia bacterium]
MEAITIKPSKTSAKINKSIIITRNVKNYTDKERDKILRGFCHPAILGKGRVLGDIVSPLYKEIDE